MSESKKRVNIKAEGYCTALSHIFHGAGETSGKGTKNALDLAIKHKIIGQDGIETWVPVVNGNAFRGILRDCIATVLGLQVDGFATDADFGLYFNGGDSKTSEVGGIKPGDLRYEHAVRSRNPIISLFGGQLGTILPGHLRVGIMMPITTATNHLVPDMFSDLKVPATDAVGRGMFTRRSDNLDPDKAVYMTDEAMVQRDEELQRLVELKAKMKNGKNTEEDEAEDDSAENGKKKSTQMIRRFETIAAGVSMYHYCEVFSGTDEEVGALMAAFRQFAKAPYVAGKSSSGHGKIECRYNLIIDGDYDNIVKDAITITKDTGFRLKSDYLQSCLDKFDAWLKNQTRDSVRAFAAGTAE